MRIRRQPEFDRAIADARIFRDADGNVGIVLPSSVARSFATSTHVHRVKGGLLFAVDEETLATMVADTLATLATGGADSETFRRRVVILRKMVGRDRWREAEEAYELAASLLDPTRPNRPL